VNELVIADVDTHMAERAFGVKEDQISLDHILPGYRGPHVGLFTGRAGQRNIEKFIYFFHKGRAIEAPQGSPAQR